MSAAPLRSKHRVPIETSPLRLMFRQAVMSSGLSWRELARRSGLHRATVGYLMNGTREGTIDTWEILLEAAGVQIGYRIEETSEEPDG